MAKIIRTEGSGITKTTILQLEAKTDLPFLVAAVKHLTTTLSFTFTQQVTRATAMKILREHTLPTDTRGIYVIEGGAWKQTEGAHSPPEESYNSFIKVFVDLDIPPDSLQGYAAQVLVFNDQISDRMVDRPDEAFALTFELGGLIREAMLKSDWDADAMRGEKIKKAAEAGDVMAHGSREHRDRGAAALRKEFRELLGKGLRPMAAYRAIAKRIGLNPKTVQRKIRKK